ncbi:hypothetical protein ACFL59_15200 [Planctomycetota bacterium]
MDPLWLLKGRRDAPGWTPLEQDAKAGVVDCLTFDRDSWALVRASAPPDQYEGLPPTEPPDGLYLDDSGRPLYLVNRDVVAGPREVIAALGAEAQAVLDKVGDADLALERLGMTY